MQRFLRPLTPLLILVLVATGCGQKAAQPDQQARGTKLPPPADREFRAAWVATVGNIDWPSKRGLTAEQQKAEAIAILDRSVELKLNAIVFQVRTSADALYASKLEPWSEFLTGKQGQDPGYDPLQFWVEESHKRGIELHAWFNPFRAMYGGGEDAAKERSPDHLFNKRPDLVRTYGKMLWLDPGEPDAEAHTLAVFNDVVERYDVDGIHIDDYFYPYPIQDEKTKQEVPFPDDQSYSKYQQAGGKLERNDWRRDNINRMIRKIYQNTKARKRHVKFGISPFGIWKPGYPAVIKGFNQYEKLYADAKLWLNKGWLDYWTPQLYWKVGAAAQPYEALLNWWVRENTKGRHVFPGNFTSRVGDGSAQAFSTAELLNQIHITRDTPGALGNVHFSMKAFMAEKGERLNMINALKDGLYRDPALVPAATWLDAKAPPAPKNAKAARVSDLPQPTTAATTATATRPTTTVTTGPTTSPGGTYTRDELTSGVRVSWDRAGGEKVWQWAVYARHGDLWKLYVVPGDQGETTIRDSSQFGKVEAVAVSAVDRLGNESKRVNVTMPKAKKQ